jgi:MarR family transcriptional regulator for hemolysin
MPQDRLRETLFYALEKSIKSYRQFAQARISDAGVHITIDQWLVLRTLQENPDVTLQQIGVLVFKDFGSIWLIVELLVA